MIDLNTILSALIFVLLFIAIIVVAVPPWYRELRKIMPTITRIFTIHYEGALITDPNETFTLLDIANGRPIIGYLDLTPFISGDKLELAVYVRMRRNDIPKLYNKGEINGGLSEPIVRVDVPPTPYGVKVTLKQTAGITGKILSYIWFSTII